MLLLNFSYMLSAHEASELRKSMAPIDRLGILKTKVSATTRDLIEAKVREVIAAYEYKVDLTLRAAECRDSDQDIAALLQGLGYSDVKVTSDFPAYCESYEGRTFIKFSIPN